MRTNRFLFTLFFSCVLVVFSNICVPANAGITSITPDPNWIPELGNICYITVTLENMPGNSSIDFQLHSTNWPGYCMNAGFAQYGYNADLVFTSADIQSTIAVAPDNVPLTWKRHSDDAITVSWGNVAPTKFVLLVVSYDYGSVGKINARSYRGPDLKNPGKKLYYKASCMLPKYKSSAPYIAEEQFQRDGWQGYTSGNKADNETGPGINMNSGDGFTAFEEYRGFLIKGFHRRLSPFKKDVFVYSSFTESIGWATELPKVFTLWIISEGDMEDFDRDDVTKRNKYINFLACEDFHYLNQKAVWVQKGGSKRGAYRDPKKKHFGFTQFTTSTAQGPARIDFVTVYQDTIATAMNSQNLSPLDPNLSAVQEQTLRDGCESRAIKWAIGHEIGHALGAEHFEGVGPIREDSTTIRASIMRSYAYLSTTSSMTTPGPPRYFKTAKAIVSASEHYLPSHDSEYKLVPDNVSLSNPERASESSALPNFLILELESGKFPVDAPDEHQQDTSQNNQDVNTQSTPPDQPYGLNASFGNGQVRLSWTAGGGTTTDYQYRYRVKDAPTWGDWISALLSNANVLSDTEVLILSLINGTTYEFQVQAMNGESASAATASSESTPATVPGKPTSLSGTRYNRGVTLRWYPPDDDGGADVTDYQYRYSYTYETYGNWTSVGGTNRSVSIGSLTNGRQYQFQVRAKNIAGYGAESLTIYKTPATTPTAPVDFTVTAGDSEVTLEWRAPYSNGGLIVTDYEYSYRESSSNSWGTGTSAGTGLSATVTGLTNGTEYEFRVCAENSVGSGSWAGPSSATPQPPPVWSNIPDPYNLTVGDSFSLDLSSYVTGSPTITRNLGAIPAGLSLSNGVLSGTVTGVEDRSIQFTATNSAGSAQSEWVNIVVNAASTPTVTAPVWSNIPDPYNLTVGDSFSLDLSSYVTGSPTITRNFGAIPAGLSLSDGVLSGTVTTIEARSIQFTATNSAGSAQSEWVDIAVAAASTPSVPVPVWSDIPDPYNLTVGDSFSLDLSSYVTGSPTITRTLGRIPAGLSLSNGILSGTVTRVETRSLQFSATNSAGAALSEWVKIIVQAAE